VDAPNPDVRTHTRATPLLGGAGIIAGALTYFSWPGIGIGWPWTTWTGLALLCTLGAFKDVTRRNVLPVIQLLVQAGACLLLLHSHSIDGVVPMFGLTIAGVVLINGVNFLDVSDGLCASVAAVMGLGFWLVFGDNAGIALCAGCLGFLAWNRPRARIFMGDVGSFFIGGVLCVLALDAFERGATVMAVGSLLILPALEMAVTLGVRLLRTRGLTQGDDSHLSLRLLNKGVSPWAVVVLLVAVAGVGIATAHALHS
jgi:UDP-GlcNAc:undecaprenyl-phosphate GlcNAc-1-phosphate transferase